MSVGHVLIADGNPLCRGGLAAMLGGIFTPIRISEVADFGTAAACFSGEPVDLAIIELGLPGLNNIVGLRKLRTHYPSTRIVASAWSDDRKQMLNAIAAGAHGYISKNLSAADMMMAFRTVLAGQVYVPPSVSQVEAHERHDRSASAVTLTGRQKDVVALLSEGKSNKEIARALHIAEGTVKVHVTAAFRLLGVHNRVSAAAALMNGDGSKHAEPFLPGLGQAVENRHNALAREG